jgi:hypothetical protein
MSTNTNLEGFSNVNFSPVNYIDIDKAISSFKYLYELDPNLYIRKETKLNDEELEAYTMALTVPKDAKSFYIRVWNPFYVWEKNGERYLINGNSRLQTMGTVRTNDKNMEFAPIPYILVESEELSESQILRLQMDANDTTRKNNSYQKHLKVQRFLDNSVKSGMSYSEARKYICNYFGSVSQQTVSNAKALFAQPLPLIVLELFEDERATVDGAVDYMAACKSFHLDPTENISQVLVHSRKGSLNAPAVKKWREKFIADNQNKQEVILEQFKETKVNADEKEVEKDFSGKTDVNVKDFSDSEAYTKHKEVAEIKIDEVAEILNNTQPSQNSVLLRIAASLINELPSEKAVTHHEAIKDMLSVLLTDNTSQELLARIKKTLG